jgi:cation:H+ antiporter
MGRTGAATMPRMSLHPALIFLGGLVILVLGAELLLRGATRMAAMLGVRPILIGLTVVAIGTSTPELAVGLTSVREGMGSLSVGNIAGANLYIILFLLGLSALLRPLPLHLQSVRLDVPVMIATALALVLMTLDGQLSRIEGALLLCGAAVYLVLLVRQSRRESAAMKLEFAEEYSRDALKTETGLQPWLWNLLLLAVGIALCVLGANQLVAGAVSIARLFGVPEAVIGLTIVAFGTNAPEAATTLVATWKNDRDVAIGNLIGSSITNILVILGLTLVAAPGPISVDRGLLWIDLPLAALVAIVCYPVFRSGQQVSRLEGGLFVSAYLLYLGLLFWLRA